MAMKSKHKPLNVDVCHIDKASYIAVPKNTQSSKANKLLEKWSTQNLHSRGIFLFKYWDDDLRNNQQKKLDQGG